MGNCRYCGKSAGFLRHQHRDCAEAYQLAEKEKREAHQHALSEMQEAVSRTINGAIAVDALKPMLFEIARRGPVSEEEIRSLVITSWEATVHQFLEQRVLTQSEEAGLDALQKEFDLTQDELNRHGAFMSLTKAVVLREVLEGKLPTRVKFQWDVQFNFQKNESPLWAFNHVAYLEDKTKTMYVGRSQGMSIKICKGVYYRVGAFKGQPVSQTELVHVDTGPLAITTKHIYFAGSRKAVNIPHAKVVTFTPYSDGVGIMRDGANAKRQVFVTGDGWFTYNLLTNVSNI